MLMTGAVATCFDVHQPSKRLASIGQSGLPLCKPAEHEVNDLVQDARLSSPVTVTLESANGSAIYASAIFSNITDEWTSFTAHLTANATDHHAVLAITTPGPALEVDVVSLFPQANGVHGSTSPFRTDLLQLLKDLKPG